MNVFTDYHHSGLLQSLIMLFEGRLGGNLYRPIGVEWASNGFWKVHEHPATLQQYLGIGSATPDGTPGLNDTAKQEDGIYYCHDIDSGYYNKAVTLDKFLAMDIDIVIASIPKHVEPFKRLCELHPSKPKLIYQIGNAWSLEANSAPNVMASAIIPNVPSNINFVQYHQEFDLKVFKEAPPVDSNKITSFVNCFSIDGMFDFDWHIFKEIELAMPDWDFKCLGGQCRDGAAHGTEEVARIMGESRFIWHTKYGGDGYGHIVFNTGAVGRPMIVRKQYYAGKLGEKLMFDGKTCIDIDRLSTQEIVNKINYYNNPEMYAKMFENIRGNFIENVNFDHDEIKIRDFLSKLV
jgi:hypothetical protein